MSDERLLTINDVAERLQVSHDTVDRLRKSREIRFLRLGNRRCYRTTEADLQDFIERRREEANTGRKAPKARKPFHVPAEYLALAKKHGIEL